MGKKPWKQPWGEGYRLPIEQRFGPRIPDYLGDKGGSAMANVLAKADDRMHKNLDKELNYELSKL
jgi:hypothetical protein